MDTLCADTDVLQLWLDIERHCVLGRCDALFADTALWTTTRYQVDNGDTRDDYRVPECCDAYVILLRTCAERFRLVTDHTALVHYAHLQVSVERMHSANTTRVYSWNCSMMCALGCFKSTASVHSHGRRRYTFR
jgi:hypothetical protein